MYEFESRVRYSEVDANCNLKLNALVNYLQDCTIFHSEDVNMGVEYLKEKNQAWVLNYWQVDILKLPRLCDNILVTTIPYEVKGFRGLRNFIITDKNTGERLVVANTIWTLLDIVNMRPAKASQDMIDAFATGEKIDMEYTDRKILVDGEFTVMQPITVGEYMLDTNHHVNNEKYIEIALAYIPAEASVSRIRVEYKQSAVLGDVIVPQIFEDGKTITVCLKNKADDTVFVTCQFVVV